jgi:uncharacterized integral membrane protein
MKLALVASIVVATITAIFAGQNAQQTQVTFFGWYFEAPLVTVLLITFTAGAVAAFLATLPTSLRRGLEIRRLRAQLPPPAQKETAPLAPAPGGSEPPPSP